MSDSLSNKSSANALTVVWALAHAPFQDFHVSQDSAGFKFIKVNLITSPSAHPVSDTPECLNGTPPIASSSLRCCLGISPKPGDLVGQ